MEFTGRAIEAYFNTDSGKFNLVLEVDNRQAIINGYDEIKKYKKLDVTIEKHSEKRSLDANAYAWVLMQKLAEVTEQSKWDIYLQCLERYSKAFTHVIVKEAALERMQELYRTSIDLGVVTVNGQTGHQLQVFYGSSTFNSVEMGIFLNGIISECHEHGIDAKPPDEVERMKMLWQSS